MSLNYLVPLVKCVLSWKINLAFFKKTTNCLPMFICRYIFSQQRFCDNTQYICCFLMHSLRILACKHEHVKLSKIKYSCVLSHDVHWGNDIHLTKTNTVLYYFWNLINVTFHLDLWHFEKQVARRYSFWGHILSIHEIKE